ncbi:DUF1501 domain-containing protein [Ilumatobacter sp.]|uniref:DUF1501 domain-containing protein n=1 Tax=Ilumatobacter sp. TaxID=1967498 RepID=UPI003B52167B
MSENNSPHFHVPRKHSRRQFLTRTGMIAATAGFATPFALDLAGVSGAELSASVGPTPPGDAADASAADALTTRSSTTGGSDYRALVCVFLSGGNDHNSTYVPYDTESYGTCRNLRPDLTPSRSELTPLGDPDGEGRQLSLAPELRGLAEVFASGDLAVVANLGTLKGPTTKAQYLASVTNRPAQLFSHNDQQTMWQTTQDERSSHGWGGRLADLMLDGNGADSVFTCMSTSGNTTMMTGSAANQYHVDTRGVTELAPAIGSDPVMDALRDVMGTSSGGLLSDAYRDATRRALSSAGRLASVMPPGSGAAFPNSSLGDQLAMVARLIDAGRNGLGLRRQVFFVSTGGFDVHARQTSSQPELMRDLCDSLLAFRAAMLALGTNDQVTSFTASDFGRTLTSNGDGTDHGWGSHHMVMGGSVLGGRVVGRLPQVRDGGDGDVGRGRLIPTTAVDQYASTMAKWMGAKEEVLSVVTPNVRRFETADLGLFPAEPLVSGDGGACAPPPCDVAGDTGSTSGGGSTPTGFRDPGVGPTVTSAGTALRRAVRTTA